MLKKNKLSEDKHRQWEMILEMTTQLQALSIGQDWDNINKISSLRQVNIEQFFSTPLLDGEAELISEGIKEIMKSNKILMEISQKHKKEIISEIKKITDDRVAIKAYSQF